ncbi:MAG: shikimate dehydrogenase family protein [Actinomycetota bacterium]
MNQRFGFIGVTASRSSINNVFPHWARILELGEVSFEPVDLPLGTPTETYRRTVTGILADPAHRGALVTTHKVRLLEAASTLFHELDYYARLLGEISCISKRDGQLYGHAKDPITSGQSLDAFLPRRHFGRTGAEVVCLGAGGSGLAIAVNLLTRADPADRPRRIVLVNRSRDRLDTCRAVLEEIGVADAVELIANGDPRRNDALVAAAPPGSLVVNATGMGKDTPGSPITDDARFPEGGFAWELNYRGELDFLHQARRQARERALHVEDGWTYFIHGWSAVVGEAFDVDIDEATLQRLSEAAAEVRG